MFHPLTLFVFGFASAKISSVYVDNYLTHSLYAKQERAYRAEQAQIRMRNQWNAERERYGQIKRWLFLSEAAAIRVTPDVLDPC